MLNLIKSFFIMIKAHRGQKDKAGRPYIFHPLTIAIRVNGIKIKTVALLHDVLEDNKNFSLEDFSFLDDEQLEALSILTREKTDGYFEYIGKIKNDNIAKEVKLKDLEHNMNLKRLKYITEKDIKRLEKYAKAIEILKN